MRIQGCDRAAVLLAGSTLSQLFNIFAAVLVGNKTCTVTLAARIAAVLKSTQALFPPEALHAVWVTLDPSVRTVIEKLLADASLPASPSH